LEFSTSAPGGMDDGECAVIFGFVLFAQTFRLKQCQIGYRRSGLLDSEFSNPTEKEVEIHMPRFSTILYWLWNAVGIPGCLPDSRDVYPLL
jgi:hypothetical protein